MTDQFNNGNQGQNRQDFVHEQIKEKPINWKKLKRSLLESALCGLVFAVTALVIWGIGAFFISKGQSGEKEADLNLVEDTESETADMVTHETETVSETVETPDPVENIIIQEIPLTLEDYQALQSQMYNIGIEANKSIVTITSVVNASDWFNNTYEIDNSGTGVILAENNDELLIVTEKNALANQNQIYVTFVNDTTVPATLKAWDGNTGIAVLSVAQTEIDSITRENIGVADISASEYVRNGQLVIALGSPLGTPFSVVSGSITSRNNTISRLDNNFGIYTTDISGNASSSGVLINTDGEILALIMQGYHVQTNTNLTAVPILELAILIEAMLDGRSIPYAGLYLSLVTDKIAQNHGLPKGLYIREVAMDSPAMEAGLQSGDVITMADNTVMLSTENFYNLLLSKEPGASINITAQRQDGDSYHEVVLTMTLGSLE